MGESASGQLKSILLHANEGRLVEARAVLEELSRTNPDGLAESRQYLTNALHWPEQLAEQVAERGADIKELPFEVDLGRLYFGCVTASCYMGKSDDALSIAHEGLTKVSAGRFDFSFVLTGLVLAYDSKGLPTEARTFAELLVSWIKSWRYLPKKNWEQRLVPKVPVELAMRMVAGPETEPWLTIIGIDVALRDRAGYEPRASEVQALTTALGEDSAKFLEQF